MPLRSSSLKSSAATSRASRRQISGSNLPSPTPRPHPNIVSSITENMVDAVDEMNHQDVWDDSALVQSWNEALAEYKVSPTTLRMPNTHPFLTTRSQKYHSIHATGGSVDSLLSECVRAIALSLLWFHSAEVVRAEMSSMPSLKRTYTNMASLHLDPSPAKQATLLLMAKGPTPTQPRMARPPPK